MEKSDLLKFYEMFPEPDLIDILFNIVEDVRVDTRTKKEYPALEEQILDFYDHIFETKRPRLEEVTGKSYYVEGLLQKLIVGKVKGKTDESLEEMITYAESKIGSLSDVHDSARLATEIYFMIDDASDEPYLKIKSFSSPVDQSRVERTIGNFEKTAKKIQKKLSADKNDPHKIQQGTVPENYSLEDIKSLLKKLYQGKNITPKEIDKKLESKKDSEVAEFLRNLKRIVLPENQDKSEMFFYPEWDSDLQDYRLLQVKVKENKIQPGGLGFYLETMSEHKGLVKKIQREFQMLRPEKLRKIKHQLDGDEIDIDKAVEYFIDRKIRLTPDERLYQRNIKKERDIAVSFLIDTSTSTSDKILKCEKQALILLSEAIDILGDKFSIYSFSSIGQSYVNYSTIKDFDEPYNDLVKRKICKINPGGGTLMGGAIRHTTYKLSKIDAATKLLILLTDGEPNDTKSDPIEDTRMALKEAKRNNIKTFCITVDKEAKGYLPRMYSESNWILVDDVTKLAEKMTRIYKRLTF